MRTSLLATVALVSLALVPSVPVLAHGNGYFGAKAWRVEAHGNENEGDKNGNSNDNNGEHRGDIMHDSTCRDLANQKQKQAIDTARLAYKQAELSWKSTYAAAKLVAQQLTDQGQRESALLDARYAAEDAQIAAQATLRQATRAAERQRLTDMIACRAAQQQLQSCVKTADQKAKDAISAAQAAYEAALASAKVTYKAAQEAAQKLTNANDRLAAMQTAHNAFEDAQVAAQTALRNARRAAQQQQLTDRKACPAT